MGSANSDFQGTLPMTRNFVHYITFIIILIVTSFAPALCRAADPASAASTPKSLAAAQGAAGNVATLESLALRLEVTASPYSYRVIEKSSGEVLLAQDNTAFTFNAEFYPVTDAANFAHPNATSLTADLNLQLMGVDPLPAGTPHQAQVKFTFVRPEQLQITIRFADGGSPAEISEEFADQGEHYYGIWEYPFGGNIDDRGADHEFLGLGNERYVNHSSARAPFYLTSRKYGIYVESLAQGHFSIAQAGKTTFAFRAPALTYDIFYGPTYADIFRRYNAIAGPPVIPPAWTFGSIWWRDDEHDDLRRVTNAQEKVIDDADHLRALHIPAAAIWLDRPYGSGDQGWGSMDFDASFPDPQKLVHDLNDRGMRLLLWVANRASGTLYTEGSARGLLFPGYPWPAADIRRPEAYNWFKNLLDAYVRLGIKGYKADYGDDGEMPDAAENEISALFPRLAAESLESLNGEDFFMFSRNANDTARRYTAVWSGDSWSSFPGLQMAVKNALRAGAVDYPTWGSDTGGYFQPAGKDLEARWLEFSAYSPLMEVIIGPKRTIWDDDDDEIVSIARDAATTHADLIPYVRSYVYGSRASGLPVMRALIFAYPNDASLADKWDEYLYGENLLVAPVLEEGAKSREVYLPGAPGKGTAADEWLSYASDHRTIYRGGTTVTVAAPLNSIPVFVREGAIVPRGDIVKMNNNWTANWSPTLHIEFFPGRKPSAFSYYTGTIAQSISIEPAAPDSGAASSGFKIVFGDLEATGTLEVYCRASAGSLSVTRNGLLMRPGDDYQYDAKTAKLTVPFEGASTIVVRGASSLFLARPSAAPPRAADAPAAPAPHPGT